MVRYFLCSNELPLQFTVEVMRNFPRFLHYFFCCYCWSSEKVHRWDGSSWHLTYEKLFQGKIVLEGEKVCEANLVFPEIHSKNGRVIQNISVIYSIGY